MISVTLVADATAEGLENITVILTGVPAADQSSEVVTITDNEVGSSWS